MSVARIAADAVAKLVADNEQLDYRNAALVARVAELEDLLADSDMRSIYRRGYFAGHTAGARGKAKTLRPEDNVRGDLRRLMSAA